MQNVLLSLPGDLENLVSDAARKLGISPQAFMVEAISRATLAVERRQIFLAQARAARDELRSEGLGYAADEVKDYLRRRIADTPDFKPKKKSWQR